MDKISRPLNEIRPFDIRPSPSGKSFKIESAKVDLPLPDSPTIPSVSPSPSTKETFRTAETRDLPWTYSTERFSTRNKGSDIIPPAAGPGRPAVLHPIN